MGEHSKKYLLAAGGIFVFILQSVLFGAEYFSFGKSVNKPLGTDNGLNSTGLVYTEIFVPVGGTILDIDIALNIEHTSFCDLQISIRGPGFGDDMILINYYDDIVKNRFEAYQQISGWIILDEESIFDIDRSWEPYMSLFRPNGEDRLSLFYGQQSYGLWRIEICDAVYYDIGTVKDIRLDILIDTGVEPLKLSVIPEPATVLLFAIGTVFAFKSRHSS